MISIICVGDINLKFKRKLEFEKEIIKIFEKGDIRFGNLETVVSDKDGSIKEKAFNFKANPKKLELLSPLKFDILNIANNHTLDFGEDLKKDTKNHILQQEIKVIGENKESYDIEVLNIKGKKIAFIGIESYDEKTLNNLISLINELKQKVKYVIVSIHWGIEICFSPSKKQRRFAHKLIDNGVNVIIGHHPHVLQGIEKYNKGIIIYSLGNFQFEIEKEDIELTQYTNILELLIDKDDIQIKEYPIFILKNGNPTLKLGKEKEEKYIQIKKRCNYCIENLTFFNFLKEASLYNMEQHLIAWKIRKEKKEKNYLLKKIKWFLHPSILILYIMYIINKKLLKSL